MNVLGVDPGLTGALALLDDRQGLGIRILVEDMPVAKVKVGAANKAQILEAVLADLVRAWAPDHAYVEAVHSMPKQGVSSTFTFGLGFGLVRGVLAGLGVPYTLVTPQKWAALVQLPKGDGGSRLRACQLFPDTAERFKRVGDHGRADAALIALAGYRELAT